MKAKLLFLLMALSAFAGSAMAENTFSRLKTRFFIRHDVDYYTRDYYSFSATNAQELVV